MAVSRKDLEHILELVGEMTYICECAMGTHIEMPTVEEVEKQLQKYYPEVIDYWAQARKISKEVQEWPAWKKKGFAEPDQPSTGGPWGMNHEWDDRVTSWCDNSDYEHSGIFVCKKCKAHYDDPEAEERCKG